VPAGPDPTAPDPPGLDHAGVDPAGLDHAGLDEVADELYGLRPDDFVAGRDAAVARARGDGDRDLARAIGRLRRPTRAAWLANLLARHRREQLEGLLGLAAGLADAQRSLDGAALRRLSGRRHQLVTAMAREAGRLAGDTGDSATDSVLRDVAGILEAALARPDVAAALRAGRLAHTVSYTGFGPAAEPGVPPRPAGPAADTGSAPETAERERDTEREPERERERERAERERRAQALADAETDAAGARAQQQAAESRRDDAVAARNEARDRVAELTAALATAREDARAAAVTAREAEQAARSAARAAGTARSRAEQARARLDGS
jgi:hypothetical protein